MMNKLKLVLLTSTLVALFACTPKQTTPVKTGYLKNEISQAELQNATNYKRYYYTCKNFETGSDSYLSTYFPLSKESRLKNNFGIYFQLDGGKAEPFDHIENRALNVQGSRFEVIYRSYNQIQSAYIDLVANEYNSTYYKYDNIGRRLWLECKEG